MQDKAKAHFCGYKMGYINTLCVLGGVSNRGLFKITKPTNRHIAIQKTFTMLNLLVCLCVGFGKLYWFFFKNWIA